MKRSVLIVTVAVIAFVGGLSVRGLLSSPLAKTSQENQSALPEISLPDLSGKQRSMKEWQGKVLVINFWATWCPPCLKEMPEFEAMQNELSGKGLQFIGIAIDDAEPVKEFIASKKITYPILLGEDQGTKIAHDLGNIVNTVPFTVVVNKKGLVVKSHMGELTREQLLETVSPLLQDK
jgi:thiol-disulfide isomerase/thioredoxin